LGKPIGIIIDKYRTNMSHIDVDIFEFLILTIIPVGALFIIEIIFRLRKSTSWIKLTIQGIAMVIFGVGYLTLITPHVLTAYVYLHYQVHYFINPDVQKSIQKSHFINQPNLPSIFLNAFFLPVPPSRITLRFSPNLFALI